MAATPPSLDSPLGAPQPTSPAPDATADASPSLLSLSEPRPVASSTSLAAPLRLTRTTSSSRQPGTTRRQPTQERINSILEIGLQRAQTYSAHDAPSQQSQPGQPGSGSSSGTGNRRATFVPMEPLLGSHSPPAAATNTYGSVSASTSRSPPALGRSRSRRALASSDQDPRTESSRGGAAAAAAAAAAGGGPGGASRQSPRVSGQDGRRSSSWWRGLLASFQSIELENKGSVARDHLALERTFLAWLRTSLAFASIGIAVTQLFRLNTAALDGGDSDGSDKDRFKPLEHVGRPLGLTFLAISILVLFLGYHRYRHTQQYILLGKFPASRGTILLLSLVALGLMIVSLVIVVVVRPTDG